MTDMDVVIIGVWDAVFAATKLVDGLDDSNTKQGLKFPPVGSPEVQVGAPGYREVVTDTMGGYYEFRLPIYVFNEDPDLVAGMKGAMTWAGEIRKQLLLDRELGGLVETVEDVEVDTNPPQVPGYERQFVLMTWIARCWVDDPTP